MEHLLQDTGFWVLMAMVVFVVIAFKKGRKPVLDTLDSRTARIQADLAEAARLRAEAAALLTKTQKQNRDATQEAQQIVDNARETADRMKREAEEKLAESMKRRETQLLDRIARAETAAVDEIRQQAATLAAQAAEQLLRDMAARNDNKLVDEAIKELPSRLG